MPACGLCSIHVASVVQMTHMLLCHGGVIQSKAMDKTLRWGTYWAALVHDYEHGGLNNDFLIKTAHPLAITYSDNSPLEHHHIAAATRVFLEPECQYFTVSSCCVLCVLVIGCWALGYTGLGVWAKQMIWQIAAIKALCSSKPLLLFSWF